MNVEIPQAFKTQVVLAQETAFNKGIAFSTQFGQDGLLQMQLSKKSDIFTSKTFFGTTKDLHYLNVTGDYTFSCELTTGKFLNFLFYCLFGARNAQSLGGMLNTEFELNFYGKFPSFITEVTLPSNNVTYILKGCIITSFTFTASANSPILQCNFSAKFSNMARSNPMPRIDFVEERKLPSQPYKTAIYVNDPSPVASFSTEHWRDLATDFSLDVTREMQYSSFGYTGTPNSVVIASTSVRGSYTCFTEDGEGFEFLDYELRSILASIGGGDSSDSASFFLPTVRFGNPSVRPYHAGLVSHTIPFEAIPKFGSGRLLMLQSRVFDLPPNSGIKDAIAFGEFFIHSMT